MGKPRIPARDPDFVGGFVGKKEKIVDLLD